MTERQIALTLGLSQNYCYFLRKDREIYRIVRNFDSDLYVSLIKFRQYLTKIQQLIIEIMDYPYFKKLMREVYKFNHIESQMIAMTNFATNSEPLRVHKPTMKKAIKLSELYEEYMTEQVEIFNRFKGIEND